MKGIDILVKVLCGFPRSVPDHLHLPICEFVYCWRPSELLNTLIANHPYISTEGIEGQIKYQKNIYKAFKQRFPEVKQPNVVISSVLHAIQMRAWEQMKAGTFVAEWEGTR